MSTRWCRSLVSNPITCWSVMHWVLTPPGMPCPQRTKSLSSVRVLERGFQDDTFADLYAHDGQPGVAPWRLALVTVMQFRETLADRQAAEAVRARIDWKYLLGLELMDPGFDFSVLSEFRDRLLAGKAEALLLDKLLERCRT